MQKFVFRSALRPNQILFSHDQDHRPGHRTANQCWVRIPGKHKDEDAAWDAAENMAATRH
jgi:hypothetical protein